MPADTNHHYPGTPQHQAILRAIVDHYENDPRILAVAVFGSLGRGNWDEYSDIDLDVVIDDQVSLNASEELKPAVSGLRAAGRAPRRDRAG